MAPTAVSAEGVPAGTYMLKVWHEALKTTAPLKVTVKDGETVTVDLVVREVDLSSRSIEIAVGLRESAVAISSRVTQRISWPSMAADRP